MKSQTLNESKPNGVMALSLPNSSTFSCYCVWLELISVNHPIDLAKTQFQVEWKEFYGKCTQKTGINKKSVNGNHNYTH